ncbi:MAG: DUF5320 domain-containing protein [Dehalococcoidales bacterium]|nr:DUF5320 domain-containing protein [Dehalococcoidales bacterium]
MPGFDGTGPRGQGPMTGGGRGFCSPWGMRAAPGSYAYPRYGRYRPVPPAPQMSREQELGLLKTETQNLRDELNELEARIGQLSAKKE